MNKIKYKIVVEHKDKGIIEIPISKRLLHGIADMPFMMSSCEHCWETFKLNKIDKDINKFFKIFQFLVFDVDADGYAYTMDDKTKKMKKIKTNFILVKKPRYKKLIKK